MLLTMKQICDDIKKTENGRALPNAAPITRGMSIQDPPKKRGFFEITPEQVLSIIVERVSVNGTVEGYQREQGATASRKIAVAMKRGDSIAPPSLGLDGGKLYAVDGAHRLIAAVIAKKPVWVVIEPMGYEERAKRFASQRYARRVNADVIVLASAGPFERYIQDAIVARQTGAQHPWAAIVGKKNSSVVISPNSAVDALKKYALSIRGTAVHTADEERVAAAFSEEVCGQLARIILTFGVKSTNPLAFRPFAIRAITDAAVEVLARTGRKNADLERWERHMVNFDWSGFAWIRSSSELAGVLIRHWNKRLSPERKIQGE